MGDSKMAYADKLIKSFLYYIDAKEKGVLEETFTKSFLVKK